MEEGDLAVHGHEVYPSDVPFAGLSVRSNERLDAGATSNALPPPPPQGGGGGAFITRVQYQHTVPWGERHHHHRGSETPEPGVDRDDVPDRPDGMELANGNVVARRAV